MKDSIRWRRETADTGLARVVQGYRAWKYGTNQSTFMIVTTVERFGGKLKVSLLLKDGKRRQLIEKFDDAEAAKIAAKVWFDQNKNLFI